MVFLNIFDADSDGLLEQRIVDAQHIHKEVMERWEEQLPIHIVPGLEYQGWRSKATDKFIIPPDDKIRKEIAEDWHNRSGHPGRDETIQKIQQQYLWPGACQ